MNRRIVTRALRGLAAVALTAASLPAAAATAPGTYDALYVFGDSAQ